MSVASHPMFLAIALPLLGGALSLLVPARAGRLPASLAIAVAALDLGLAASIQARGPDALESGGWLSLHVDRLSAFVLLFVALFSLLVAIYSWGYMRGHRRQRAYFAYLLWTLGAACGAVLANDLISTLR